jgi:HSP20 family protein
MENNQSQQKGDIFEMILSSVGDETKTSSCARPVSSFSKHNWETHMQEGELAVDVYETEKAIIVASTMAGADTSSIEVYVHNHDLLTIKGQRKNPLMSENYSSIYHECFWGKFSRTIVLPCEVDGSKSKAEYKNGILTIKIPKHKTSSIQVEVVEE